MMKKWLLFVTWMSLTFTAVCQTSGGSTDSTTAATPVKDSAHVNPDLHGMPAGDKDKMAKTLQPASGKVLVYILRPAFMGTLIRMRVRCDNMDIGSTKGGNFLYTMLEPGPHRLLSSSENDEVMDITVEAGKTYYVKQQSKMGVMYAETGLKLVEEQEGQKYLRKCRLAKDNTASNQ